VPQRQHRHNLVTLIFNLPRGPGSALRSRRTLPLVFGTEGYAPDRPSALAHGRPAPARWRDFPRRGLPPGTAIDSGAWAAPRRLARPEMLISRHHQRARGNSGVVLNGCESVKSLTVSISPRTIGMDKGIPEGAARAFSRGFYDALGAGRSIDIAFDEGVSAMKLESYDTDHIRMLKT
jgi:hypothetical protein